MKIRNEPQLRRVFVSIYNALNYNHFLHLVLCVLFQHRHPLYLPHRPGVLIFQLVVWLLPWGCFSFKLVFSYFGEHLNYKFKILKTCLLTSQHRFLFVDVQLLHHSLHKWLMIHFSAVPLCVVLLPIFSFLLPLFQLVAFCALFEPI